LANYVGYIYRLVGEWQLAVEFYQRALTEVTELPDAKLDMVASILNNIGYVRGLEGKYEEGIQYCLQALDIWSKAKLLKDLGVGEVTLGNIYRDRGDYETAKEYLWRAIRRFEEPEDTLALARAYFSLGWTQWFEGITEEDEQLLKDALESFENSLNLANAYGHHIELPGILHQMSNVYFWLGDVQKAREVNNRAYRLSCEISDIRYSIDSLVGKAEFDLALGEYEQIPEYAEELWQDYEARGYNYPLFYGRMRRILGDVAYFNGEYEVAKEYYAQGLAQIREHGGWGIYYIDNELEQLSKKLAKLPVGVAIDWLEYFRGYWLEQEPEDIYSLLVSWCQRELVNAKLRK
jgi:tetratricopeptide (TPR) repeat protein